VPQALTPAHFAAALRPGRHPGQRIYWPGCAGHSPLFEQWLRAAPDAAAGAEFCGVWIPGINRFDPTAMHPEARAQSFFLSRDFRAGFERGAVDFCPWHYSEIVRALGRPGRFDVVLLHVAPPDERGRCSLSVAADFTPAVLEAMGGAAGAGPQILAHVNPRLPRTAGPWIAADRITAWVEAPIAPLTPHDAPPGAPLEAVAAQVAALVRDGDVLQLGLGRLQAAVLAALRGHRRLRLHSGMVSEGLLGLVAAGALAPPDDAQPPVTTGVALGSEALYAALGDPALTRFAPVSFTHAQGTLAALPRLVAVNSALEVDLLGNVNAEWLNGRQISAGGGVLDFVRGARASEGGRAIVALEASLEVKPGSVPKAGGAAASTRSRIVPLLAGGAVTIPRADVDIVVTEHGHAALRGLGVHDRARALIAVAAPEHRAALAEAWHRLKSTL
jgi:acyl-CoA hydrolase